MERTVRVGEGEDFETIQAAHAHAVGAGASESKPWTIFVVAPRYAAEESFVPQHPGVHVMMEGMPG